MIWLRLFSWCSFETVLRLESKFDGNSDIIPTDGIEVETLPLELRNSIEADSFWCLTVVLDGIQDNYTFAQPGIQVN